VSRYVGRLEQGLEQRGIRAPLRVMKSNGGVFGPSQVDRQAIAMALSGPAAGVIGATFVAGAAGFPNAVTIDIGGTSADVSLIRDGATTNTTEGEVGPFPLALTIIDIHSIGAGGGSIGQVSEIGSLRIGPESAGSDPGPACYARGGTSATISDAHLVLGRVPATLLDGAMRLDGQRAIDAVGRHVAGPLGLTVEDAAEGMIDLVNSNMTGALKVVSVERGYDPKDFALVAFGGAGPLHAVELGRLVGCRTVVIPRHPGLLCALGLLATDLLYDYARTSVQRGPDYDLGAMEAIWAELELEADEELAREGVAPERRRVTRCVDLRYAKQGFELTLDAPAGRLDASGVSALVEQFHALHEQTYSFADRQAPVEIVTLRLRVAGLVDKVALPEIEAANGSSARPFEQRAVRLAGEQHAAVPAYRRDGLLAGHAVEGPAIVDQLDSTTLVFPGQRAEVDRYGNLVIAMDA
jgi:N-methylhydantoinase A